MKNSKQLSVLKIKHPIFLYVSEEKDCASVIYEGCPKCFPELSVHWSKSMGNVCFCGLYWIFVCLKRSWKKKSMAGRNEDDQAENAGYPTWRRFSWGWAFKVSEWRLKIKRTGGGLCGRPRATLDCYARLMMMNFEFLACYCTDVEWCVVFCLRRGRQSGVVWWCVI
jgi:hypothetical protein